MSETKIATVVDGSQIRELVENKEAFIRYVDEKFAELDKDNNGKLSPQELQPAISKIGIALGLPPLGSSPESDHIYEEVTEEFLRGKELVSKEEFGTVLSDILLGMADGLGRDPIAVETVNGEELERYAKSGEFEVDALGIYSQLVPNEDQDTTLESCLIRGLGKLTIEKGMPPASDQSVMKDIIEPAMKSLGSMNLQKACRNQAEFVDIFRKVVEKVAWQLNEKPVDVARTEKVYDGKSVTRLLRKKQDLEKALQTTWKSLPKDHRGALPNEYLRVALDILAPAAGLPPFGAVEEMDKVISEVFKMVGADGGGLLNEKEFNKMMLEVLGSIMLQLEGNSIRVSSVAVVAASSTSKYPL